MSSYARLPIAFTRGKGPWLWDESGTPYLDAISGVAVCGLGHGNEAIAQAIADQARQLLHTSNLYRIPLQEQLAEQLVSLSGMTNAFFCNSGAEANEAAIKLTRLFARTKNIDNPQIIVMSGAFHGRTMGTLSATANPKVQQGFEPLLPGFIRAPYNDLQALQTIADQHNDVVAILLEPVQGEGGVIVPAQGYLDGVRAICDQHDWLMVLDEIQTGMCRTGQWFAFQHSQVLPDVITLAKALGNGVPIGACLASGKAAQLITPGKHGSTFGGNLLASKAALAVIEQLEKQNFAARANNLGKVILKGLTQGLADQKNVVDIRGLGLMIAIELDKPCAEIVQKGLEQRVLVNVTADRVVRLLPPLILTDDEAKLLIERVVASIVSFLNS